jgi:hypothetical protein
MTQEVLGHSVTVSKQKMAMRSDLWRVRVSDVVLQRSSNSGQLQQQRTWCLKVCLALPGKEEFPSCRAVVESKHQEYDWHSVQPPGYVSWLHVLAARWVRGP